LTCVWHV